MIGRTIPMRELVDWLAELGSELVVEFPDREDVMVKRLLARKRDGSHPDYTRERIRGACLRARFDDPRASSSSPRARGRSTTRHPL